MKFSIIVDLFYCVNHYHVDCLVLIVDLFVFLFILKIIGSCSMISFQVSLYLSS